MARQTGILGIQGTVGGLTFGANGNISQAQKPRAITAVRTLENNSEFGNAATAGKTARDSFRQVVANISDKMMTSRMTKKMREIISTDAVNDRGQRGVIDAEIELLNGFEFNEKAILSTIAFMGFTPTIVRLTGAHAIAVDAFNAARDVSAPTGTTHLKLVGSASSIDFEAKDSDGVTVTSALIPYANDVVAAQTLALPLPAASAHPIVVVFGVEFYQEVNGKQYLLGNGAYTTSKVVAVDGGV